MDIIDVIRDEAERDLFFIQEEMREMAYKSKCTCVNRKKGVHPRDFWHPHEEHCYYYEKLKQEAQEREDRESIQRLYKHYRSQNKSQSKQDRKD